MEGCSPHYGCAYIVLGGVRTWVFQQGAEQYRASSGMLVYLKPGEPLEMRSDPLVPLHMIMVLFDCCKTTCERGVWRSPIPIQDLGCETIQVLPVAKIRPIADQFQQLVDCWVPGNLESEDMSKVKLRRLLDDLGKIHHEHNPLQSTMEAVFHKVREELERQYKKRDSIEGLSAKFGISPSYLRKLFIKYTGHSPKAYVNEVRNEHVKRYLLHSDSSMKEIADACGYVDEFHLGKMFKKRNGISPGRYRKRYGNPPGSYGRMV